LRLLLHYAGDIHQPLHATSRVNHEYPQGDRGGNSVALPSVSGAKNLHSVWDSLIYSQAGDLDLPFADKDWESISTVAKDLMAKHPIDADVAQNLDVNQWAKDSYEISASFVYEGVTPGEALSDDYIKKGQELAEKQVVIGGNRLASLLKTLDLAQWKGEIEAKKASQESYVSQAVTYLTSLFRVKKFKFKYDKDQTVFELTTPSKK
jgi:hypothetical protein